MESCLHEATQLLADHNPQLMREFEKLFSQTAATATGMFPQQPTASSGQTNQSNVSMEERLEQTFQQMKQNKSQKVIPLELYQRMESSSYLSN